MFGRVAAFGIAASILVSPSLSGSEINAFVDLDAPADGISAMTHDRAQDQGQDRARDDPPTQAKVAALDLAESSVKSPALTEPFGLKAVPVETGELLAKWAGVKTDIRAESEILTRCQESAEPCSSAVQTFLEIIADGRAHTGRARIGVINRAINLAIHPTSDLAQWGVPDRWSAPLVTLSSGRGDCEDYAIAKYVALKEAGVADDDVRLVIVRNLALGEDHAIVAARLDGNWIMLDNRWLTLVEDSEMRRTIPLFVLDHNGVKQFVPTSPQEGRITASREGAGSKPASLGL